MGTAFVAVADDPSAILHNPAGLISSKGTKLYGGGTVVIISSTYNSPTGGSEDTEFRVFFPPHQYISSDLGMEDMVFGVGIYSPFGIGGRKWDRGGLTRFASVRNDIATLSVNPTVAWQVLPALSVGAGIDYMKSFNTAERMIDQSFFGAGDGQLLLDGDGSGWGYNLGAIYNFKEQLSFGLAYRSGIEIDTEGTAKLKNIAPALQPLFGGPRFKTDADTTLDFPEIWSIGVAYRPTGSLVLALDLEWVLWSSFDKFDLDLENEVPAAEFTDSSTALDWEDVLTVKVGVEYKATEKLSFRGGYAYVETPVPAHTLEPGNPDSDQHNFSIGFGYIINKWVIDAFYNAGFFEDRKVDNAILSGEYENFIHYTGFSVGYILIP
jgi:long-chain fatty acid transport protein